MFYLALALLIDLPFGFVDASGDDFQTLSQLSDQYVVSEAALGDYIVFGKGEITETDSADLALVQFGFKCGHSTVNGQDVERFTYFHQPVFVEREGEIDFSGKDVDCIKTLDKYWMATAVGPAEIKKDDFKKLFKSTHCFHPMMGPFLAARDLGVVFGFRPKIVNEQLLSAIRKKESKPERRTFLLAIPGAFPVEREIVFDKSLPVEKRDFLRNPKRELISSTKVKWSMKNEKMVPTEFEFTDTQSGQEKVVSVKLDWSFGKKIDLAYFEKDNLGKATLDN